MTGTLDEILARLNGMQEFERAAVARDVLAATADMIWVPNPGPQTDAYRSLADTLLYGGSAGGGKTDILCGLAFNVHRRSLLMRRQYTDLSGLTDRAIEINGTSKGFNGSTPPRLRTRNGRIIEFGAAAKAGTDDKPGDEENFQGRPRDFLGVDETVHFAESQIRFLMGWVRTKIPGQRTRTVLASNPPLSAEGQWVIGMFRPWLDDAYANRAKPGELRWYVTDPDGNDFEVSGPEPYLFPGQTRPVLPQSRTFIPAALDDNPYLINTGYRATLDAMKEPMRSALRDGNFMLMRKDSAFQVIPSAWVRAAQARWTPQAPAGVPMCAIAADIAQGGDDDTVLATRFDGWFPKLVVTPGKQTPTGASVAGLVVANRRGASVPIILDMGGGYGGAAYEWLKANQQDPIVYKGANGSKARTVDKQFGFYNKRSETVWRFREALDPDQPGGSPIALPDDPMLVADLTAPTFEVVPKRGIKVESKEDVCARLKRSTDRGDAVMMCWTEGPKGITPADDWRSSEVHGSARRFIPRVLMGRDGARAAAGRR